jgi:uncharacterized protein (TIGR00255 family)
VNRKTLDLAIRLPAGWESLEPTVGDLVRKVALRGRISVSIELTGVGRAGEMAWDEAAVGTVLDRLAELARGRGVPFVPTPELLWSVVCSQRQTAGLSDAVEIEPAVTTAVSEALRAFAAMRAREGEALLIDFIPRLAILRRQIETITARAPLVPAASREQLLQRLRQAELELDPADERVLREVALFADRCDVTEELTRLRSHLEQFAALIRTDHEIGRKAEFILQEIGREVNTIGSKANDLAIARAVIEFKNELERVREQMANVE